MKSQNQIVLDLLKKRSISAYEAMTHLGIGRLAARVNYLRSQGAPINTKMVQSGRKRYAVYSIGGV